MVHHRRSARSDAPANRGASDVTEIIAFGEFGALPDMASRPGDPFAIDFEVLSAPELDDLNDLADESPRLLLPPPGASSRTQSTTPISVRRARAKKGARPARRTPSGATVRASAGSHRRTPESTGATHSRLVITAIAAGAVAAAANAAVDATEAPQPVLVADTAASPAALPDPDASGMQIVPVANGFDAGIHRQELANGTAFAQERAQREARLRRPQVAFPTRGILTSGFGARWGTLHAGLDIANAVGTPIYAASDGEVIASGPTPGFGMWVKIRATDGTVTLYGHIDTTMVQTGERVMAGDQIATMGNKGNSTGPHLHFEVHRSGSEKTDPMAWLRQRGVANG
ncbi:MULTISPECIES: M23 family metallopeptidase [Mycolicibacterium]|uniref:Peptidase M23 n=2 Tax=Mycolicibacterium TaxID=1866885 RepID=A0A1X1TGF6_9MYCO|nr:MULTISPECIES: M23 family metallopeptidase [Mycolicibacterium]MCV7270162.1 peptidoglycan DD-metalloendopeptidase family protein [Mycolicibacterium doricum]MDA4102687.1 peptidase M23 [Mycolicibacterium monacense DSM 44395]OBB74390.1 peptidase M23 [Mycolicibacterium monacense]OBF53990.1 peptidase M23 [Mycolicibacterium monacense]ORB16410.1 peptidase M23 [Mycolicibacterium monacense DSM 44395]